MKSKSVAIISAFVLPAIGAVAQSVAPPEVPDNLRVAAGEKVFIHARAKGVQIYSCAAGTDGKFAWTLKAPKAELFDEQGNVIGEHFAGPTGKLKDGSEVSGKMVAKHDAPKTGAIPWLLVTVTGHKGSGAMESVTTIQRVNTDGGVADAAKTCDASKNGTENESSYSADYYFYAPRK
jgi:hypothetical protein